MLTFLLLNPSTADHKVDDMTIRRCMRFAERDGFNAIQVVNLFAYRCTRQQDLAKVDDPVGPENDGYITAACRESTRMVVAWGSTFSARNRVEFVERLLAGVPLWCLGINHDGSPKHPLYVPGNTRFVPYVFPHDKIKVRSAVS
jgi:hypothetical protein